MLKTTTTADETMMTMVDFSLLFVFSFWNEFYLQFHTLANFTL